MSTLALGLGLALLASVALNSGFLAQHVGAQKAPAVSVMRPLATLRGLLRSRVWTFGLVLGLGGWLLHVAALANAPLSLVQPFAAGGLALAVPVAARFLRERLSGRERIAVAAMVVSLVGLAVGVGASPAATAVPPVAMVVYLLAAVAAAGLLAMVPAARSRPRALGAAAGVLYGAGDAATKAVTAGAHGSLIVALTSPWALAVAIVSIGAFFAFQRGLQTGPAIPVIALMTVMTNLVAVLGGLVVFGEPLGATPLLVALHTAAFALAGVAAWLLARAHARLAERGAALQVMGATETVSGSAPLQRTTRPAAAPASTSLAGVEHGI